MAIVDVKGLRGLQEGCELVDFHLDFSQHLPRRARQKAITPCKDANATANGAKTTEEGKVQVGELFACCTWSPVIRLQRCDRHETWDA